MCTNDTYSALVGTLTWPINNISNMELCGREYLRVGKHGDTKSGCEGMSFLFLPGGDNEERY